MMRFFLLVSAMGCGSVAALGGELLGQAPLVFEGDSEWGVLDAATPVKDCHAMVEDARGRLILLTNDTTNNLIIYSREGRLLEKHGTQFPGAHGMKIRTLPDGTQRLYIADTERHMIFLTDLEGLILREWDCPMQSGHYARVEEYKPTDFIFAPDGGFYVLDGYGKQVIHRYDADGVWTDSFGEGKLRGVHGGTWDDRGEEPVLVVTSRGEQKFVRFTPEGEWIDDIPTPGAAVSGALLFGRHLVSPALNGMVLIFDDAWTLVSVLGGHAPVVKDGALRPIRRNQETETLLKPHGVCIDRQGVLYVAHWNSGQTYPVRLSPQTETRSHWRSER